MLCKKIINDCRNEVDTFRERALRAASRYRAAGYPAEVMPARIDGERGYGVVVSGAATRTGAVALGERFEREFGVDEGSVQRREESAGGQPS
jgi:hypothetical protein